MCRDTVGRVDVTLSFMKDLLEMVDFTCCELEEKHGNSKGGSVSGVQWSKQLRDI